MRSRVLRSRGFGIGLAAVIALNHSVATAQSGPRNTNAVAQAIAAYEAQDYERALRLFQDAYVIRRDPALLFNIAATLERLHRIPEAIDAMQNYLGRADNPDGRRLAETRLASLRAQLEAASSSAAPSSDAPIASAPPSSSRTAPVEGRRILVPGAVIAGIGAAALVAGIVVFATSGDPGSDPNVRTEMMYRSAAQSSDVQRVVGGVVAGVGIAAAAVGLVLMFTLREPVAEHRARLYFAPDAHGASVGAVYAF